MVARLSAATPPGRSGPGAAGATRRRQRRRILSATRSLPALRRKANSGLGLRRCVSRSWRLRRRAARALGPSRGVPMTHLGQPDELDDAVLDLRFREYQATRERSIRNELVEAHRGLAARIANDYRGRGVELDDLVQIALLGILKAVERFDPDRGIPFSSFASRTVNGEIKRYFRDRTWAVRPPRSSQERHLDLRRARANLSSQLGRSPSVAELAAEMGVSTDEVLDALEAAAATPASRPPSPPPRGG